MPRKLKNVQVNKDVRTVVFMPFYRSKKTPKLELKLSDFHNSVALSKGVHNEIYRRDNLDIGPYWLLYKYSYKQINHK